MPRLANANETRLKQARPKERDYRIGCGDRLFLRITPAGGKYWQLRYYRQGIKEKEAVHQFGAYPQISLAQARVLRDGLLQRLANGEDPVRTSARSTQLRKRSDSPAYGSTFQAHSLATFSDCARAYIDIKTPEWRNAKHASQWTNTLAQYAAPIVGHMPIATIGVEHVLQVLQPIWLSKTETASRLRGRIEAVLDFAKARNLRTGDNPATWKGGLQSLLAAPAKASTVQSHPAMAYRDLPAFMQRLVPMDGISARALTLLILCACRSGEVRHAQWAQLQAKLWTIPAERMKAGKEHRVPLSRQAQALLEAMQLPGRATQDWIFAGSQGRPLSDMTMTQLLRRAGVSYTVHGFRSSFRDWAAEQTQYPREVCEQALAHQLPDRVEAAYLRTDYLDKRAALMQDWADFVMPMALKG